MTQRQARDEGAAQTQLIVQAVKRARMAKGWSAAQLADEMAKAGVPWNESVVANLDCNRRKSLRVHEWLTLSWVLDVDNPLDLLVPLDREDPMFPVTPDMLLSRQVIRSWLLGETGPLQSWLRQPRDGEAAELAALLDRATPRQRRQIIMLLKPA